MKVKTVKTTFDELLQKKKPKRKRPPYPGLLFRTLVRILSVGELKKTKFTYKLEGMKKIPKGPCLFLMNHSSFIDPKMASKILYPKPYNIIVTADAMLSKEWLMRRLGCVSTNKFTPDVALVFDMMRIIKKKKRSVLLYPEAGYSFDGTTTTLPKSLGALAKKLGAPIVTIISDGAYLYDPLYNELKKRKVKTSAKVTLLLEAEGVKNTSADKIQALIEEKFSFDNFKTQYEKGVLITEKTRADGLHRVLYRCPCCKAEGKTIGKGETLTCTACGKVYRLEENGRMKAQTGDTEFSHIPDWFAWQRECVKKEILDGNYKVETAVEIGVIYDYKRVYMLGNGTLTHDENGFYLNGENGKIEFSQPPLYSYSVNADFYWYEGSDVVSIGNSEILFYCFPKDETPVAKLRLATEELYKIKKEKK
ncbi:MAG: 1-acyl-sn-glycerol-3-phosphate acyltransferase [Clostridia bacterium]|nr:1-acyl-sn-glycerol-3-phosphate acyltransferase [Clostridia bacterium]